MIDRAVSSILRARLALAFLVGYAAIALGVRELYPISAPTMFAYPLARRATYELRDAAGRRLPASAFGLQVTNPHDPPVTTLGRAGYGRRPPATLHRPGEVPPASAVIEHVRAHLAPGEAVTLRRKIHGDLDGRRVGVVEDERWRVVGADAR
ncbi:MAG: hypothetical protein R3A51_09240 [Nannocystaceae bacterium]|nr:hypothetical protein [Myxococcales bacterium]